MAEQLKVLDIFSGIGGFSLGLERTGGFETVAFCEIDPFCRAVLAKHWPDISCHDDITTREFKKGEADVITGGFPCQDISCANASGQGLDGERSGLWAELARLICELRPEIAILENSAALLYRGLSRLLGDLAAIGYGAEWHCLRACSIGAPFEGDRIYILATPDAFDGQAGLGLQPPILNPRQIQLAHSEYRTSVWLAATCGSARMGHGFSDYVDRRERTELLGNAVVPQVVELIGRAIISAEEAAQ